MYTRNKGTEGGKGVDRSTTLGCDDAAETTVACETQQLQRWKLGGAWGENLEVWIREKWKDDALNSISALAPFCPDQTRFSSSVFVSCGGSARISSKEQERTKRRPVLDKYTCDGSPSYCDSHSTFPSLLPSRSTGYTQSVETDPKNI